MGVTRSSGRQVECGLFKYGLVPVWDRAGGEGTGARRRKEPGRTTVNHNVTAPLERARVQQLAFGVRGTRFGLKSVSYRFPGELNKNEGWTGALDGQDQRGKDQ